MMEYIIIGLQVITLAFFLLCECGVFDRDRKRSPVTVMERGRLNTKAMRETGLDYEGLMALARQKGVFNIGDIDVAVYEADGSLSILPKPMRRQLNPKDFNFSPVREGMALPVVENGLLLEENIEAAGVKTAEVIRVLEQRGRRIEGIALATINDEGRIDVFEE